MAVGVVMYLVFFPVRIPNRGPSFKSSMFSNLKQVGTGLIIYQADYDERMPICSTMPGLRASLRPYIKSAERFKGNEEFGQPEFNFAVAGVNVGKLKLLSGATPPGPEEIPVLFSLGKKPELGVIVGYADAAAKQVKAFDPADLVKYQFDRGGATLAPPNYLADQDPLKE